MPRLTLFVKGNVDVHDSLHSCRIGGELLWNGINTILREDHPEILVRLRHETWTRSDALLQAGGAVPAALQARNLPLGIYDAASQFSTAVFDSAADVIILSLQPDVTTSLFRHKNSDFLLYPYAFEQWSAADKQWLKTEFIRTEPLDASASAENLRAIIARIRRHSQAPVLVFNMSPIVPGESLHCFQGLGETFSTRVRRFNLALAEISETTGISIIDVDALLAGAGALAYKLDALHLNPAGYRLVAAQVVRVLCDLGVITQSLEAACAPA